MLQFIAVVPFGLLKLFQHFHYQDCYLKLPTQPKKAFTEIPTVLRGSSFSNFIQLYTVFAKMESQSKYSDIRYNLSYKKKWNFWILRLYYWACMMLFLSIVQISMKWVKANQGMHTNHGGFIYLSRFYLFRK